VNRRSFLAGLAALLPLAGCSTRESAVLEEVTIVNVYDEEKTGDFDGTTVVALSDGQRYKLGGKLGKVGDKIMVRLRDKNGRWANY
jgi:hypothetical protein